MSWLIKYARELCTVYKDYELSKNWKAIVLNLKSYLINLKFSLLLTQNACQDISVITIDVILLWFL